jgi:hypothetical protein
MTDRLIEIGIYNVMEINVEKTKVITISVIPNKDNDRLKTAGEYGILQPFG